MKIRDTEKPVNQLKRKVIAIAPEFVLSLTTGVYSVNADCITPDARIVECYYNKTQGLFFIVIASDEYDKGVPGLDYDRIKITLSEVITPE